MSGMSIKKKGSIVLVIILFALAVVVLDDQESITGYQFKEQTQCYTPTDGEILPSGFYTFCKKKYRFSQSPALTVQGPAVIDGNGAELIETAGVTNSIGLSIDGTDVTVKDLKFKRWGTAIHDDDMPVQMRGIRILHNSFKNNAKSIEGVGWKDSVIEGNIMVNKPGKFDSFYGTYISKAGIELQGSLTYKNVGNMVIKDNVIILSDGFIGLFGVRVPPTAITLSQSIGNSYTDTNNLIEGNYGRYEGCEDDDDLCGMYGIWMGDNTLNSVVRNNKIVNPGNIGIHIKGQNNEIRMNQVLDVWARGNAGMSGVRRGIGMIASVCCSNRVSDHDNVFSFNTVVGKQPAYADGQTTGFYAHHLFFGSTMIADNDLDYNEFRDLDFGYLGDLKVDSTSSSNRMYRNNFLDNGVDIDDQKNVNKQLSASEGYYKIHAVDCNIDPATHYCTVKETWLFGEDLIPFGLQWPR